MTTRRRLAVYDRYWTTLGGGEVVAAAVARVAADDFDVTLLGPEPVDVERLHRRLGFDLSGCAFAAVDDDVAASRASSAFDAFVNVTYRSAAINRSPHGYYYVHFPGELPSAVGRWLATIGDAAQRALDRRSELPAPLQRARVHLGQRIPAHPEPAAIATYDRVLANSSFTARWCRRLWGLPADVLYPPVRPDVAGAAKRRTILSIGRFFTPESGHCKKQLELVQAFGAAHARGRLSGWRLVVVGGCDRVHREYALRVKRAAAGLPVDVYVNASGERLRRLLGEASIFWHAAGLDEDPVRHPDRFEHFGIVVVEAMAAGVVPIVLGAAGPAEIVRDGVDGAHFASTGELLVATERIAGDDGLRAQMAAAAVERADAFSFRRFSSALRQLFVDDGLVTG